MSLLKKKEKTNGFTLNVSIESKGVPPINLGYVL